MTSHDDRELEAIDSGLARLFADNQPAPADFTMHVLRRVQDQRWKREVRLGRVLYAGICASGVLLIAGVGFASAALPKLSGDAAMTIAVMAMLLAGIAIWPRLSRPGLS